MFLPRTTPPPNEPIKLFPHQRLRPLHPRWNPGWTGVVIMLVCAAVCVYTGVILGRCWLMVRARHKEYQQDHPRRPYPAIGHAAFGTYGRLAVSFCVNATLFGTCVVFLLLAAQNISELVYDFGLDLGISYCSWLVVIALLLCPITWLGTPKDFWQIAMTAAMATGVACVFMIVQMAKDSQEVPTPFYGPIRGERFLMAFGTICFGYGGHPGFPTFQVDMKQPEKFGISLTISYLIILAIYVPVSVVGYTVYGSSLQPNLLMSISPGLLLSAAQVLVTLHLVTGSIILINPVSQEGEELLSIPSHFGIRRVGFRTTVMGLVLFTACTVPQFGVILSLLGASTMTMLVFILPPIFYLRLSAMKGDWGSVEVPLHEKALCVEIVLAGTLVGAAATYSALDALTNSEFSTPCYV